MPPSVVLSIEPPVVTSVALDGVAPAGVVAQKCEEKEVASLATADVAAEVAASGAGRRRLPGEVMTAAPGGVATGGGGDVSRDGPPLAISVPPMGTSPKSSASVAVVAMRVMVRVAEMTSSSAARRWSVTGEASRVSSTRGCERERLRSGGGSITTICVELLPPLSGDGSVEAAAAPPSAAVAVTGIESMRAEGSAPIWMETERTLTTQAVCGQ